MPLLLLRGDLPLANSSGIFRASPSRSSPAWYSNGESASARSACSSSSSSTPPRPRRRARASPRAPRTDVPQPRGRSDCAASAPACCRSLRSAAPPRLLRRRHAPSRRSSSPTSAALFVCPVPLASIPCLSTSIISASTMPSNLATSSRNLAFSLLRRSFSVDSASVARTRRGSPSDPAALGEPARRTSTSSSSSSSSSAAASRRPVNARSEEMSATVRSHARSRPRREDCPATEARRHPDDDAPEFQSAPSAPRHSAACSSSGTGAPARRSLARRIASSARRSFARRYASSCGR